jgi:hypothetical protein
VVTAEQLTARRAAIAGSADLQALARHVAARNAPAIERLPPIPEVKALLSVDGGRCPEDGTGLAFDPWSPDEHACPSCGRRYRVTGTRAPGPNTSTSGWPSGPSGAAGSRRRPTHRPPPRARSAEILRAYGDRYFRYPNHDNVLGPSRLFFSTYLESIWILNYLGAAALLREAGQLDEQTTRAVQGVADEAANLIGEYDEGFSNRQTWNDAALCAIAVWFEDEDLARRAVESETGLVAHLRGYREDGLWYEGENYHLFALRGMLTGAAWAAQAGADFFGEGALAARLATALRAPALTALPDFTFPARKDARFGVSLAQPSTGLGVGPGNRGRRLGVRRSRLPGLRCTGRLLRVRRSSNLSPASHSRGSAASASARPWWALLEMPPDLPSLEAPGHR